LASNPSLIWPTKPISLGPLSLSRDPLLRNGQLLCSPVGQRPSPWDWSSLDPPFIKTLSDGMVIDFFLYIKALSDGMVIDFLMFTSRPFPMEWSLIFLCLHQGPLWWNGHWFSYVYIKALFDGMVIDFLMFTSRPSLMEWSFIFLCLHQGPLWWNGHWFSYVYIKALSDGMVIDFLMFTSRSSPMEWPLIFLWQDPLLWNDHLFLSSHQGPLQWNGHWFLCHIKTLSNGMVINFFVTSRPSPMEWSLIFLTLRPSSMEWLSLVFTFHIMTLFTELVIRPVWIDFYSSFSSWKSGQIIVFIFTYLLLW